METENKTFSRQNIVVILLAIILTGVVYYWKTEINNNDLVIVQDKNMSNEDLTPEGSLIRVKYGERVKAPEVFSEEKMLVDKLPEEVVVLFDSNAEEGLVAKSVVYVTQSTGFVIEVFFSTKVLDSYKFITQKSKADWKIVYGGRIDKAAVLNLESNTHWAVVDFMQLSNN